MGLPLSALPARSESFVLVDRSYRHSGWSRLYSTWDFATRIPTNRDAPKDWEQPVDFKNGTYQFRVEVLKMGELGENAQISFGWINSGSDPQIKHTTGNPSRSTIIGRGPGRELPNSLAVRPAIVTRGSRQPRTQPQAGPGKPENVAAALMATTAAAPPGVYNAWSLRRYSLKTRKPFSTQSSGTVADVSSGRCQRGSCCSS
jgi:hypothetical protein